MTTDLRTTLNLHASDAGAPELDLGAILTEGTRRDRRRRGLVVAGAGLAALATAASLAIVPNLFPNEDQAQPATSTLSSGEFMHASGDTIWFDGAPVSVPGPVASLAQTDQVAVYTTPDSQVRAVSAEGDVTNLGRADTDAGWVRSSASHAAWIAPTAQGDDLTVTAVDTSATKLAPVTLPTALVGESPEVLALDGSTVVLRDERGVLTWDAAAPGQEPHLLADAAEDLQVVDANAGLLLAAGNGGTGPATFRPLSGTGTAERTVEQGFQTGRLNADNSLVLVEGPDDEMGVRDLTDGRWLDTVSLGRSFTIGYRWIDANTFLAASTPTEEPGESAWQVRRCTVPAQGTDLDCTDVTPEENGPELILPF